MEVDLGTGVTLRLVFIPAGEFAMGDAAGYANERPLCKVKIERPFWMGKTEVSNAQYRCFAPSHQSGMEPMLWLKWSWEGFADLSQPRQPVCRVSWREATAFCRWLSQKTGRRYTRVYDCGRNRMLLLDAGGVPSGHSTGWMYDARRKLAYVFTFRGEAWALRANPATAELVEKPEE